MQTTDWKQHALDLLKAFIGAIAAGAGIAAINFFVAHVPDALAFLGTLVGGLAGTKTNRP